MFEVWIFLVSYSNVGDGAHMKALSVLLKRMSGAQLVVIDAGVRDSELLEAYSKVDGHVRVLIAVGEKGLYALNALHKHGVASDKFLAVSLHQYNAALAELPLNFVALPKASLDSEEKKDAIASVPAKVLTIAVPAPLPLPTELEFAYNSWKVSDKPSLNERYIAVMLPGDAPDPSGRMRYFSIVSAQALCNSVVALWFSRSKADIVLVHNGPRTGKHNQETGAVAFPHEQHSGDDPASVDSVSTYFTECLHSNSVPHVFYNFVFEIDGSKKTAQSVLMQLYYLVRYSSDNIMIAPGESVSMLSEATAILRPEQIIAFQPDSMNSGHTAILQQLFDLGHLCYFDHAGQVIRPETPQPRLHGDSESVVDGLIKATSPLYSLDKDASQEVGFAGLDEAPCLG